MTVEKDKLVSRMGIGLGPAIPHRVRLALVGSNAFEVKEYPQDARLPEYRPSLAPRVILLGDHGALVGAGIGLTVEEGREASKALNHLIGREDIVDTLDATAGS